MKSSVMATDNVAAKLVLGATAFALIVATVSSVAGATVSAQSADTGYGYATGYGYNNGAKGPVQVHGLYNAKTGDHLYTADAGEANSAAASFGYTKEGVKFHAFDESAPGTDNVYRAVSNRGDHFYTADFAEYANALRFGYNVEGVAFKQYADAENGPNGKKVGAVTRLNNHTTGDHLYAGTSEEAAYAVKQGYKVEGTAFFQPVE